MPQISPVRLIDFVSELLPMAIARCNEIGDKEVLADAAKELQICIKCYDEQKRCQRTAFTQ